MYDRFQRRIDYLRISVTDRCNLRCVYCRPAEGVVLFPREEVLTLEEIHDVAAAAVDMGIRKIRLTGGEPLVRKGIVGLVARLARLPGLEDLAMTTNATHLVDLAPQLKAAGLRRVNVSLDTLDPDRFRTLTRGARIEDVLAGIEAARNAGLTPIKLNCVVRVSSDEPDARMVRAYAKQHGYQARFIREMNLETGDSWVVEGGSGGDCRRCGRLRLTSRGDVLPCLFSDLGYNIRALGVREAIVAAVHHKPESGRCSRDHSFLSVGG
ncbi:MAG: radical SAM protein [Pseudomonadota bacterium]